MVHCILRRPGPPLDLPAGMREIAADGLAAVVSDVESQGVRAADRDALLRYADLNVALHRITDLIPMRFGCVLEGDTAIRRLLEVRRGRLCTLLDKLDGCVELGIRLLLPAPEGDEPPPPAAAARPGHAHLAEVRRRLHGETRVAAQAQTVRAAIESAVAGLFRDTREEVGAIDGRSLLSLYYLVPRDSCERFRGALGLAPNPGAEPVADTGDSHRLISGPWPPYNFVGAIDDDLRSLG